MRRKATESLGQLGRRSHTCFTFIATNTDVPIKQIGKQLKGAVVQKDLEELRGEQWQGRLLTQRWDEEEIGEECFACMTD